MKKYLEIAKIIGVSTLFVLIFVYSMEAI